MTDSGALRSRAANQLWKVRTCTGRPAASTACCSCASRATRGASGPGSSVSGTPRMRSCATSLSGGRWANSASQSCRRSRISPAAFLVKVMARMSCGAHPSSKARTMRETSIQVLPAPAQASTATLRRGSQAMA